MQFELRTQTVEPVRNTFTHLINRYGDRPATRYEEGTIDVQPTENFHYRPQWDAEREIYDERYSALRLTDPYSFTDPRQYYYAPYVTARAQVFDAVGKTLDYIESRGLFGHLPAGWLDLLTSALVPLRHYEGGAQLISTAGARFAYGTTIEQCLSFAAFDRIGNAQLLSRVGLALGGGAGDVLADGREAWLNAPHLQPLRKLVEQLIVEPDWAVGAVALDLTDQLIYPLMYRHMDERALHAGAGAYSLITQHLDAWFTDQRKWFDMLLSAWLNDPEHGAANGQVLADVARTWLPEAVEAVRVLARSMDASVDVGAENAAAGLADSLHTRLAAAHTAEAEA